MSLYRCLVCRNAVHLDELIKKDTKIILKCKYCEQKSIELRSSIKLRRELRREQKIKEGKYGPSSSIEIEWINSLGTHIIKHHRIDRYTVDGYDPRSKTIYEFLGDFWHGNLDKYKSTGINKIRNITFGNLNRKTFFRLKYLKNLGYTIKYIWESDYRASKKNNTTSNLSIL